MPSHKEAVIAISNRNVMFTGVSGSVVWVLGNSDVCITLMWSIPYNLKLFNSYFSVGVFPLEAANITSTFLAHWYTQMINYPRGTYFERKSAGQTVVVRHKNMFAVAKLGSGYKPILSMTIMPWKTQNLSPFIWHKLYMDTLNSEYSVAYYTG